MYCNLQSFTLMMASAQVVETSVNTNNSPSQDYTTNPDDHSNHNIDSPRFKPFTVINIITNKHSRNTVPQTAPICHLTTPPPPNINIVTNQHSRYTVPQTAPSCHQGPAPFGRRSSCKPLPQSFRLKPANQLGGEPVD